MIRSIKKLMHRRRAQNRPVVIPIRKPNQCRVCGCSNSDACRIHGVPCVWIERDLCSACAPIEDLLASKAGRSWVLTVIDHAVCFERCEQPLPGRSPCACEEGQS